MQFYPYLDRATSGQDKPATLYIYRSVISAIPDADMPDQEIVSAKHGRLLTVKTIHDFKLRLAGVAQLAQVPGVDGDHGGGHPGLLRTLASQEFAALLRGGRLAHLLESNMVHMNWVPVVLGTEVRAGRYAFKYINLDNIPSQADIEFATRKRQVVLVDSDNTSLSILTLPYPCPGGRRQTWRRCQVSQFHV